MKIKKSLIFIPSCIVVLFVVHRMLWARIIDERLAESLLTHAFPIDQLIIAVFYLLRVSLIVVAPAFLIVWGGSQLFGLWRTPKAAEENPNKN